MHFYPITDPVDVETAFQIFFTKLTSNTLIIPDCRPGFKGGHIPTDLHWHKTHNFWFGHQEAPNRHWNVFGYQSKPPRPEGSVEITCELNIPYGGIDRTIQGVFAHDSSLDKHLYVLHRGTMTITAPKINEGSFIKWMASNPVYDGHTLQEDTKPFERPVLPIAQVDGDDFLSQIETFVKNALHYKQWIKGIDRKPI